MLQGKLSVAFCWLLGSLLTIQAQQFNLTNPEEALKAERRIHCSLTDGEPAVFWWQGHVYSRVQGEKDRHLFDVQGMNVRACVTLKDANGGYGYRQVSREVMFYLDPDTDQILRTWKNPWTGKDVEVVHVANDPVNMRPSFAHGARGDYKFDGVIKDGWVMKTIEVPLYYPNPLGGDYQPQVGGTYQAIEMFGFFLPEQELLDMTKSSVDSVSVSWTRVSQWLPWMEMGDRPGQMMFHATGKRLRSYDDLPDKMKQEISANYPAFKTPPPLDDQRPNETSWTYYKKILDAKRGSVTMSSNSPAASGLGDITAISPAENQAASPEIALGSDNSINVIWVDRVPDKINREKLKPGQHTHKSNTNLFFARSTDGGRTFSNPIRINGEEGTVWGFSTSKPRIAIGKSGTVHVFYSGNRYRTAVERQAVDAMYVRSTDGGRSFEKPVRLNTVYQSKYDDGELNAFHGFGTMGVAPNGTVHVYWIDTRHMSKEGENGTVYGVISHDDGKTFDKERKVLRDITCPCCQLWLTFSPDSKPYLSLRRVSPEGSRDSAVARSDDKGKTFSEPVAASPNKWVINACPLKPTSLAVDKQGRLFVTYYSASEQPPGVYVAVSEDGGKTFSPPQALHPEAKVSGHPNVSVGADGIVYVAWDAKVGDDRRVYMRVSTDHGKSFGPRRELGAPTGSATYPSVAVQKDGAVLLAWQQNDRVMFQALPTESTQHRH